MILNTEQAALAWMKSRAEWSAEAGDRLEVLSTMLRDENQLQNLVSAASLDAIWVRHFADSAQLLNHVPRGTIGSWLDLGTGAGFPGLVIAILRPDLEVVMVESRSRRVEWLNRVCDTLSLRNASVAGERVETLKDRKYCVISARAFAPLPKLLDLSARFSTSETVWVLPKGRSARQEMLSLSGWNHMFHVEQSLTDADSGIIVGSVSGGKGKKT